MENERGRSLLLMRHELLRTRTLQRGVIVRCFVDSSISPLQLYDHNKDLNFIHPSIMHHPISSPNPR